MEDEDEVVRFLKMAYDYGFRTFDVADAYSDGHAEILLGKFLQKCNIKRSTVVIMTKVFNKVRDETIENADYQDPYYWENNCGLSKKYILDAVDQSVRRLGTYIDVLQIHRLDKGTPKEEIMETLNAVVKSGKTLYIGASSMRAVDFARMQFIAERQGWAKFINMQNLYNLTYREEEREMIPFCEDTNVAITPFSPLARGVLARPFGTETYRSQTDPDSIKFESTADEEIVNRIQRIAQKRAIPMAQVSLAWLLSKGAFPIVGLTNEERMIEALGALKVTLTKEEIQFLEDPYAPKRVLGYDP
jgi:aryl-alcohol dehydrogenase-like predicted oxidoreductase